jgi:hypothetical protein
MQLTLTLPLPHHDLNPNARPDRHVKAGRISQAREQAKRAAFVAFKSIECPLWLLSSYKLKAYFKTNRHQDDDNISASAKSYRDGIADAANQDDRHFRCMGVTTETDRDNPRLEIVLEIEELV